MAKNKQAATALHMQFQNRSVRKTYLAIACGVPSELTFAVDAPVDRHDTIKCARFPIDGLPGCICQDVCLRAAVSRASVGNTLVLSLDMPVSYTPFDVRHAQFTWSILP